MTTDTLAHHIGMVDEANADPIEWAALLYDIGRHLNPGTSALHGTRKHIVLGSVPIHAHTTVIPGGEREWVLSAGGRSWRL
jgi:hypothetical protein